MAEWSLNGVLSVCVRADRDAPVLHCVSLLFALCVEGRVGGKEPVLHPSSFQVSVLSISPMLSFFYIQCGCAYTGGQGQKGSQDLNESQRKCARFYHPIGNDRPYDREFS